MFQVGQKVVCVADEWMELDGLSLPDLRPQRGQTYTVAATAYRRGYQLIDLAEIKSESPCAEWASIGFRPLIDRKSSTSTGFEILDDIRKLESFDAPAPVKKERV